jgi:UDP-glucose 4-epimerase
MRWLITGGCGFIGRTLLARVLRDPNAQARVVDDLSVGVAEELRVVHDFVERQARGSPGLAWSDARVELIVGDIRDASLAHEVTGGADVVVHLAANTGVGPSILDPQRDCTTNVIGTLNYLEGCRNRRVRRFVFASSGAPIGECVPPIHEELPAHPVSPYGASKLAGEAYCSAYARSFGVETVALRFGNCYGPLSTHKGSIVAKFIREALAGQSWEIYGDGGQTRDFVFVEDVVDAIMLAATAAGVGGEVFQIATSTETSVLELAAKLSEALKRHGAPAPEIRIGEARTGDVRRNYSDTTKARTRLGWTSRVPLEAGLERTVDWFLRHDGASVQIARP